MKHRIELNCIRKMGEPFTVGIDVECDKTLSAECMADMIARMTEASFDKRKVTIHRREFIVPDEEGAK